MSRVRFVAIALLVIGAGLFAVGTAIEKSRHHDEGVSPSQVAESHGESGEPAERRQAEGQSEARSSEEGTILGIDRESTGLVLLAVLASLILAGLLWRRPSRWAWVAVGVVTLAFAVFDVAEVVHQLNESASGLALLASAVAAMHFATAGVAARSSAA